MNEEHELARLREYQRRRANDEEREIVGGLKMKLDAGLKLTEQEWAYLNFSPYGFGQGCAKA